jgi:hypothetical protein
MSYLTERFSLMQLEETASSKDVPPLSYRGVFGLPGYIAQNNTRPVSKKNFLCYFKEPDRDCWKSLV